jgi:hypothetical protein
MVLARLCGFKRYEALMNQLGKHRTGRSCLYLKKLEDADPGVLTRLIRQSVADMLEIWG